MEITLKLTKKRVAAGVAVIAAVGTLVGFMGAPNAGRGSAGSGSVSNSMRTVVLEKRDISSSISATGTVYSANTTNVYSDLNYPVQEILVSVGDQVEEGDVLARLDSSSLEAEIAQKQASINTSAAQARQTLTEAQLELENYKRNLELGFDSTLLNAESSLTTAQANVKNAELDLSSAQIDAENAYRELRTARSDYRDAQNGDGDYCDGVTDSELDALKEAVTAKENNYEKTQASYEKARSSLEQAELALEKAQTSLEAANTSSEDNLIAYENRVKSAQISADQTEQTLSMQNLQQNLAKCEITAPASGTITSVSAIEGNSGNGLLFVIQAENTLKVITGIEEYDIGSVHTGDRVVIQTEATGDAEFEGTLSRIAPTSTLTATGDTADSTDAVYEAEISVSNTSGELRIGMNAQLSIITEEHTDVFAVPFEAVATDPSGSCYVFEAQQQDGGGYIARKINVATGIESDLYTEISGDTLAEGMLILRSASGIQDGQELDLPDQTAPAGNGGQNVDTAAQFGEDFPQGEPPQGMPGNGGNGQPPAGAAPPPAGN